MDGLGITIAVSIVIFCSIIGILIYGLYLNVVWDLPIPINCKPLNDTSSICYYKHDYNKTKVTVKVIPN